MEKKKGQEMAKELGNFVNSFRIDTKGFVEELTLNSHRTLQQSTMRLFIECCKGWAQLKEKGYGVDARNQATVNLAEKIVELTKDCGLPMI